MATGRTIRFALLLVALIAAGGGVWLGWMLAQPYQGFVREGVFVEVPRGAGVRQIARLLEEHGVVRSSVAFEALCRWRGQALQAGEYFFDRPATAVDVFEKLAEGRIFYHTLVIREGLTLEEIAAEVEKAKLASRESFLAAARDPAPIRDLAPQAKTLEGFLFPATYQFPRRVEAQEIAAAMVRRFREVWQTLPGRERPPRGLSAYQVVTLASLVERETRMEGERPLIAGVFYNRLRLGMPLECDPTVIYALQLAGRYTGTLLRRDLHFPSPYNTYRNRGLPPGPIAGPGEAALRAALSPAATDYIYFVSDAQGGHWFSRTLREHNTNVARYRRLAAGAARPRSGE
jgi:UPF0755 protein